MATPRFDLENNPKFREALLDENRTIREVMLEFNCSHGFVADRRRIIREGGEIGTIDWNNRNPEAHGPAETSERVENEDGTVTFKFIRHRPVTLEDARELIRSTGDDPDAYWINIRAIAYGGVGSEMSSNKIEARQKTGIDLVKTYPLAQLYAEAAVVRDSFGRRVVDPVRATVVNIADMQIGKTGRRGGSPELFARLARKRELLREEYEKRRPSRIMIADIGDGVEGFESGGNPMFTNDLSHPDQIDAYGTELLRFIRDAAEYAPVDVVIVCSNHAAWRNGKQTLGKPSDDWGIHVHKQVEKITNALGLDVTYHYPEDYDESIRVDLLGVPLGFVHGNQFAPGKAVEWWQKQAFGSQAITHCDVLVTGHYHHAASDSGAGTNPFTGRERIWLQAPTLDNGSDWYRNVAGRDSEPGLMIFDVTTEGFDLGSLNIL